ncbi:alanine/glycine:cation symporter family protein [Gordonia hydrophobica]|uniref:Alanine/glycine:cation symporter family protein n=1 Tax=Gordonia hydrophobica TaxID=40516 RepID=A0ABZ2U2X0_9ACTN|nr:alanine/glycine:cation symporter family protein [Gordonia hydrophobica]MBM7367350.1 AGCS family alanine or glycine:cation symporter [Gordonia hydrophobica]
MGTVIDTLNEWIWSRGLIFLCLGAGIYFTIRSRFLQVRHFSHMISLMFKGESSESGVSSFQALAMSLAGRVGAGNIVGVATAIAFGGPGALFWMWATAFLGASTSFVECTLGQIYKTKDPLTGEYRGGPAYYFHRALRHTRASGLFKIYALLFAAVTVLACGVLMPGIQANSMAESMHTAWPSIDKWVFGTASALILGFVIIGGVKRIANFAAVVVPFMAIVYIALAVVVVLINADQIPETIRLIFSSAFGLDAGFGAILGSAIMWGVKRGIYSNEAGQGTGPHAAAAAEVSHPAKQGLVQAFAVYIDTLFVCSATGFLILSTGAYRVYNDESVAGGILQNTPLFDGVEPDPEPGATYVQVGFDTLWSGAGASFVAISLAFFCFTTIIAYYYMAETNLRFLLGKAATTFIRPLRSTLGRDLTLLLQATILVAVVYGAVTTPGKAWALGDIGVGAMAWLNIIGILILQQPAYKALRDYESQLSMGKDPVFDPKPLGIRGATFWESYSRTSTEKEVV